MFYNTKPERLARDKWSSLLGTFASYEENKVLLHMLGPYSQHLIFFITYESAQLARLSNNTMPVTNTLTI
jgi:hypothetical protein